MQLTALDAKRSYGRQAGAHRHRDTIERLLSAGYRRVVAVDQTNQEFQVPVVHVVVPGLRFWK